MELKEPLIVAVGKTSVLRGMQSNEGCSKCKPDHCLKIIEKVRRSNAFFVSAADWADTVLGSPLP